MHVHQIHFQQNSATKEAHRLFKTSKQLLYIILQQFFSIRKSSLKKESEQTKDILLSKSKQHQ